MAGTNPFRRKPPLELASPTSAEHIDASSSIRSEASIPPIDTGELSTALRTSERSPELTITRSHSIEQSKGRQNRPDHLSAFSRLRT